MIDFAHSGSDFLAAQTGKAMVKNRGDFSVPSIKSARTFADQHFTRMRNPLFLAGPELPAPLQHLGLC